MGFKYNKTTSTIATLLVAALSVLVYINIINNGFVYDDHFVISRNRWIEDFSSIGQIILSSEWSFLPGSPTVNYYRPTFHLLNMISRHIFGPEPWGYHLSSIILHTANALLVVLIARRLLAGWSTAVLLAGLFFAAHPVHAESVSWLSAESDLIYSLFVLTGLYAYMGRDRHISGGHERAAPLIVSAVAFFFGLISKETAVVLPVLALVYDLAVLREPIIPLKPWVKRYLPFTIAFVLYMALRLYALGGFAPESVKYNDITPYQGFINIFQLIPLYIGKLFWPVELNISHHITPILSLSEPKAVLAIISVLCVAAFIIWLFKRDRLMAFLCIWVLLPLFPALYIPALGRELFAERYLYLPSAGFVIAGAIIIERILKRARNRWQAVSVAVLALTIVFGYTYVTFSRTFDWRDDYTIWKDAVEKSPQSGYPRLSLAVAAAAAKNYSEAAAEYEKAIKLGLVTEDLWTAEHNRGRVYMVLGRLDDAITAYTNALAIHPDKVETLFNLAIAYEKTGQLARSAEIFARALDLSATDASILKSLGRINRKLGNYVLAAEYYQKAIEVSPADGDAMNNLGIIYSLLGDYDRATQAFTAALEVDPENENAKKNLERALKLSAGSQAR